MSFLIEQQINLRCVNSTYRYAQPLECDDAGAHLWRVVIRDGQSAAELSGASALCCVTRPASAQEKTQGIMAVTVTMEAQIDAQAGVASCLFDRECYAGVGDVKCLMQICDAHGLVMTAARMTATIVQSRSDAISDPQHLLPSVSELKAMGKSVSTAMDDALAAAEAARNAAQSIGITVMGQYDNEALLRAAHPTGNPGDAYAVGEGEPYDAYIWDADAADWKCIGKIDINGVGRNLEFKAIKRKVLAMSGGMFNLRKAEKRTYCQVTEHVVDPESTSVRESFRIRCGHTRTTIVLVTDGNSSNLYRVPSINGKLFTLGSVYVSTGGSRAVTLKEINIDNKVYPDFEVLKTDGFRFKKLFLIYEQTGTYSGNAFNCVTTICITPDGFSVLETIDNDAAVGAIPDDFIKNGSGRVKEKAKHGNRLVFGYATDDEQLPPYDDTFVETIEDEGLTSFKRFSFGGVD